MKKDFTYNRILCAIDFSDCSRKAFYVAIQYANLFDAELTLMHVREQAITVEGLEQNEEHLVRLEEGVRRRLDELSADGDISDERRAKMELEIRGGKPWVEITDYANMHGTDLIIMGTHGSSGFLKSVLIGSQAEKVVRRANCHVLVVKPEGFDSTLDGLPSRLRG